jgi:methanogenic corrinoid protein MtbC1
MPDRELEELVAQSREPDSQPADTSELVRSALEAVKRLDPSGLEQAIETAAVRLGQFAAIEQVIVPMMDEIGRGWHEGRMRIMHEHLASAVVRSFLGSALRASEAAQSDRGVVIAAPSGQFHELGALACAVAAGSLGMRVTYLGANVPADEILAAVDQTGSSAVVLSVVFPAGLTRVQEELSVLRRHLPEDVRLVVGGASAAMLGLEHAPRSMAELKDELAALLTGNPVLSSQPS